MSDFAAVLFASYSENAMSHQETSSDDSRPQLSEQAQSLLEQLRICCGDPAQQEFLEFCGERIGYPAQETQELIVSQVLPFLAMRSDTPEEAQCTLVPSAGVSTLMELAASFGPEPLQLHCHAVSPSFSDPAHYLQQYDATRSRLLDLGFELSDSVWPQPASISLSDTKRYKGCPGSQDNSSSSWGSSSSSGNNSSYSSSSYSSSSSSSGGGGGGGCLPLLLLGFGYLIYLYPYHAAVTVAIIIADVYFARWIPSILNGAIWGAPLAWLAHWGVPRLVSFLPQSPATTQPARFLTSPMFLWIAVAISGLVGLAVGYGIGQSRKGLSS